MVARVEGRRSRRVFFIYVHSFVLFCFQKDFIKVFLKKTLPQAKAIDAQLTLSGGIYTLLFWWNTSLDNYRLNGPPPLSVDHRLSQHLLCLCLGRCSARRCGEIGNEGEGYKSGVDSHHLITVRVFLAVWAFAFRVAKFVWQLVDLT